MATANDGAEAIITAYHTLIGALHTVTIASWLDLDLSMAQLKTLFVVGRAGTTTVGQVAETLRVGMPTASHLLERLVQEGLVERTVDVADRRRTLVELTTGGAQLVERLRQGSRSHLYSWIAALEEGDKLALVRGLEAIGRIATNELDSQSASE